jgi:hypothetical protein
MGSWEDIDSFIDCSPTFQLEDELLVKRGGDVMWGRQYKCRPRSQDRARTVSKGLQTQQPPVVNDN